MHNNRYNREQTSILCPPVGTQELVIQPIKQVQWSGARQTESSHQGNTDREPNKLDTTSEYKAWVIFCRTKRKRRTRHATQAHNHSPWKKLNQLTHYVIHRFPASLHIYILASLSSGCTLIFCNGKKKCCACLHFCQPIAITLAELANDAAPMFPNNTDRWYCFGRTFTCGVARTVIKMNNPLKTTSRAALLQNPNPLPILTFSVW